MPRRTKIVCTLGPASNDLDTIRGLIQAGMDVVRLNFSHGTHESHRRTFETIKEASRLEACPIAILQDLQGPKIRIGEVRDGGVLIHKGQRLTLTTERIDCGDESQVYVSYKPLVEDVQVGGRILMDDGQLELEVLEVQDCAVLTEVIVGGPMRSRKGVNLPHIKSSAPSLTKKDLADLEFGLALGVDIIALSFVRTRTDVQDLMRRVRESGKRVSVIAKIEKPEAVDAIDDILAEADGIMVARGDLGIEMPIAKLPTTQKLLIRKGLEAAKPVITATQMLESMIENPRPTRAEASDVANAVMDGTDAVMLSGETAVGKYPIRVVETMARIIEDAEQHQSYAVSRFLPGPGHFDDAHVVTQSVSYTAFQLAEQVGAQAIACLTASGTTARAIARHRPSMPIYAFTDDERLLGQLGMLWGTKTFAIPFQRDTDQGVILVRDALLERGLVDPGDLIVLTAGMPLPEKGRTNMIHVSRI